ncbi:hypothetical protein ETC03_27725, partial [Geobacillus sp. MMMUD3]|nr:hypothetical protein [Geobacillus sp. MMMUD3]
GSRARRRAARLLRLRVLPRTLRASPPGEERRDLGRGPHEGLRPQARTRRCRGALGLRRRHHRHHRRFDRHRHRGRGHGHCLGRQRGLGLRRRT